MATATVASAGPRYAPEDPTLPKPWKGLVDGKTGYLYFWNPETNVTQYERPGGDSNSGSGPQQRLSSASVSSSVQVQHSSQGQRRDSSYNDDDDKYSKGSSGGSKFASESRSYETGKDGSNQLQKVTNGEVGAGYGGSSSKSYTSLGVGNSVSAESYRRQHEITVSGNNVPPPFVSFEGTGLPSEILREVQQAGFSAPTPIQAQSWPIALQGRDIVAVAKTGSGKTLGYLIPGFVHLKRSQKNSQMGPTVLVLSPTRELATQIQDEAVKFGKSSRISCTCLYGGAPKGPQLRDLDRGVNIVVATPGRLNDILEMRRVSLHQVSYLVLDEADRMLDMGFEPQIRKIVKEVPTRRQTLMYTATWPKEVRKIAADLLVSPVQINIGNIDELVANKAITQHVELLPPMEKHRRLEQILRSQEPGSKIIIFCSTKRMCDQLARNLTRQFGAAAIHGDKSQGERDHVLGQFRTGKCPILVATDVAARGLDVKDIRVVVNYDFPTGVEDYVHRIGRTGRAGATGVAHTFFGDQDGKYAKDLIKVLEGANQRVPAELRAMASRGGGYGRPTSRWGSSASVGGSRGGGRNDSGYGIRSSSYGMSERGGRGSGRDSDGYGRSSNDNRDGSGGYQFKSFHERMAGSGNGSRARSRSRSPPNKGSRWDSSQHRARSRSPEVFYQFDQPPRLSLSLSLSVCVCVSGLEMATIGLNSGLNMPMAGVGVWRMEEKDMKGLLLNAIKIGYRHFDCAADYKNEAKVGEAFAEAFQKKLVKREDLFITTKLWNSDHGHVEEACKDSLEKLQLDYLDLYLVHFPLATRHTGVGTTQSALGDDGVLDIDTKISLETTWHDMENLVSVGLTRNIGVSNYDVFLIRDCLAYSKVKPAVNQIETHPYFQRESLVKFCQKHGICVTAHTPLGGSVANTEWFGSVSCLNDPVLKGLAQKYKKTVAQIVLRWGIQRNIVVIPKSSKPERLEENFKIFDFELTQDDMYLIKSIDRSYRTNNCGKIWGIDLFA